MKKIAVIIISVFLFLSIFTSCNSVPEKWTEALGENKTFSALPSYNTGDITSAVFDTSCNIKVQDNSYDNFVKYIELLKKDGFKFLPFASEPENYSLNEQGQASWRATDGKVYLMIIFNQTDSEGYKSFGESNVTIYGYDQKPEGWGSVSKEEASKEKSETKSHKNTDVKENSNKTK